MLALNSNHFICFVILVIEDLTRKTGNFKQFSVFANMLESAITSVSNVEHFYAPITLWLTYKYSSIH